MRARYHLPSPPCMDTDAWRAVRSRAENRLNVAVDGTPALWGRTPEELLAQKRLPPLCRAEIVRYAAMCFCHEKAALSLVGKEREPPLYPQKHTLACLRRAFGSFESFCYHMQEAERNFDGVGYLWVSLERELCISPLSEFTLPRGEILLCFSLWEHAYLETHGTDRAAYFAHCLTCADWDRVEKILEKHGGKLDKRDKNVYNNVE